MPLGPEAVSELLVSMTQRKIKYLENYLMWNNCSKTTKNIKLPPLTYGHVDVTTTIS